MMSESGEASGAEVRTLHRQVTFRGCVGDNVQRLLNLNLDEQLAGS